jgi:F-box/leucine-rich repeat protein 6
MAAYRVHFFDLEDSSSAGSSDEDYSPAANSLKICAIPSKRKSRQLGAMYKKRKRRKVKQLQSRSSRVQGPSSSTDIAERKVGDTTGEEFIGLTETHINELPAEVLLNILLHVVACEGALPFLIKSASVCRKWRDVSSSPKLWHSVVLENDPVASVDGAIQWLCRSHTDHVTSLQLCHCKTLTRKGCTSIQTYLTPTLNQLYIDSCVNVRAFDVISIANHMKKVSAFVSSGPCLLVRTTAHIGPLLHNPLQKLELNVCSDFLQLCCLSLRDQSKATVLNLSHLRFLSLTAEQLFDQVVMVAFQQVCPSLEQLELHFPQPVRNFNYLTAPDSQNHRMIGFRNLTTLVIKYSIEMNFAKAEDFTWECHFLRDLLYGAPPLTSLTLSGFSLLSIDVLCSLVPSTLRSLSLSRVDYEDTIHNILTHFYQLRSLCLNIPHGEISSCVSDSVLASITASELVDTLEELSVPRSNVTDDGVRELLQSCYKLNYLNLEKCRSLSRGLKQTFVQHTMLKLRRKLLPLNS